MEVELTNHRYATCTDFVQRRHLCTPAESSYDDITLPASPAVPALVLPVLVSQGA